MGVYFLFLLFFFFCESLDSKGRSLLAHDGTVDRVSEIFHLRQYMHFESRVLNAEWMDEDGKWTVTVERKRPDGSLVTCEDRCDVFLYATGALNRYKWPEIKGLEKFKGRACSSRLRLVLR